MCIEQQRTGGEQRVPMARYISTFLLTLEESTIISIILQIHINSYQTITATAQKGSTEGLILGVNSVLHESNKRGATWEVLPLT